MRRGAIHTGGNTRLNVIDFVVEGTDFANVTTHFKRGGVHFREKGDFISIALFGTIPLTFGHARRPMTSPLLRGTTGVTCCNHAY